MQIPDDLHNMAIAWAVAQKSTETTKVGAVLVDSSGTIVSVGFNSWGPRGLIHAEEAALSGVAPMPAKSTLYVTMAPCLKCADYILFYDVVRVVCGPMHPSREYRCAEGLQFLDLHGVEVDQTKWDTGTLPVY